MIMARYGTTTKIKGWFIAGAGCIIDKRLYFCDIRQIICGEDAFIGFDVFYFADELGVQSDLHDLFNFQSSMQVTSQPSSFPAFKHPHFLP